MPVMSQVFRWFIASIAAIFLSALLEPFGVKALTAAGWYDKPASTVGAVMNWLMGYIGVTAFPWVVGSVFGLTAGAWLDWFLRKFDRDKPTKAERLKSFYYDLVPFNGTMRELYERLNDGVSPRDKWIVPSTFRAEVRSLFLKAKKVGLATPDIDHKEGYDLLNSLAAYLAELMPLARDGHFKEAKKLSADLCRRF